MLHFGTLISIVIVYIEDVKRIIIEFLRLLGNLLTGKKNGDLTDHQRLGLLIIAGSVPTAIIDTNRNRFVGNGMSIVVCREKRF